MVRAALQLVACAAATAAAFSCHDDADCEYLGSCQAGTCVCARGFTGPSCGSVNVAPAPTDSYVVWPSAASHAAGAASSWGFTTTYDPADNQWHAFVAVACGAAGVVADGGGNSWIAHVSSSRPDGDFSLVSMVVPQTTFGPHVVVGPDGTFVHVFRVNILNDTTLCGGNGTDPLPHSFEAGSYINNTQVQSGDPEHGTNIYIAWASRMAGPWSVVKTNITGAGDVHKSNPSIWALKSPVSYERLDGTIGQATWAMAYRYNPPSGGEQNAIALAEDFRGPWQCTANISAGKGNSEDPFVWQQPDAVQLADGMAHILYHNGPHGYHAFGPLNGSQPWRLSPTQSYAFVLNVTLDNGSLFNLQRRERPELRFRADGTPAMLYNGVVGPDGSAFTMGQPIN